MPTKVAIVTGANRGIGLAVVRKLCKEFNGHVFLTARNTEKGLKAIKKLESEGLRPKWHELDVTQPASIWMFRDFIEEQYGGVDVLINNAGVMFEKDENIPVYRMAELTVQTNFRGTLTMCKLFLPLLRPHARLVVMSSKLGMVKSLGEKLQKRLDASQGVLYDLECLMNDYLSAVRAGVDQDYGWPEQPLQAVNIILNVLVTILARDLKSDIRRNILVNSCCPSLTATEAVKTYLDENGCYGGEKARQPDEAAADVVWLALLPSGTTTPNGELVQCRKILNFKT